MSDYTTMINKVSTGMSSDFSTINSLEDQAAKTSDPGQLQKIQMQSQMVIQHMTALKQLGDDIAGAMKKWSEPVHPTQ